MKRIYKNLYKLSPQEQAVYDLIEDTKEKGIRFNRLFARSGIKTIGTLRSVLWRINRKIFETGDTKGEIFSRWSHGYIRYQIGPNSHISAEPGGGPKSPTERRTEHGKTGKGRENRSE